MRNIITISVPPSVKKSVDNIMKENKYASVSELFRDAVRSLEDATLIKILWKAKWNFPLAKAENFVP